MKNMIIKASVTAALVVAASDVAVAGFVTLPTSGTTPYVQCRTAGNFGSGSDSTVPPTTDSVCAAPNGIGTTLAPTSSPESGFTLQSSNTSSITAFSESIGNFNETVFKSGSTCIYNKQLVMTSTTTHDYNPQLAGTQKLEVNDFAFGGYTGAVSAAYAKAVATYSSAYRIGRTYTSVQMQAAAGAPGSVATGYLVLPTAGGTVGTEINGVGQTYPTPPGSPTAAQQEAPFSANWVDFTVDVTGGVDEDGTTSPASPNMYIKQACTTATTSAVANSMKIRQTGQETQPWVTITTSSRAPSSTITP